MQIKENLHLEDPLSFYVCDANGVYAEIFDFKSLKEQVFINMYSMLPKLYTPCLIPGTTDEKL